MALDLDWSAFLRVFPLWWLGYSLHVITVNPCLVTFYDAFKEYVDIIYHLTKILTDFKLTSWTGEQTLLQHDSFSTLLEPLKLFKTSRLCITWKVSMYDFPHSTQNLMLIRSSSMELITKSPNTQKYFLQRQLYSHNELA